MHLNIKGIHYLEQSSLEPWSSLLMEICLVIQTKEKMEIKVKTCNLIIFEDEGRKVGEIIIQ